MVNTQSKFQQSNIITECIIKNVKELENIIPLMDKAEFQRQSYWVKNSNNVKNKKNAPPSYNEYIKYLYKYRNSGDGLTFGVSISDNKVKYIIIDGNNRLNAIMKFIKYPLWVFEFELKPYIDILRKYNIPEEDIFKINYKQIYDYKRLEKSLPNIYKICENFEYKQVKEIEDAIFNIQEYLIIDSPYASSSSFLEAVKITITECKNGTRKEYNNKFIEMNKYDGQLTASQMLAGTLYPIPIVLQDNTISSYKLIKYITNYYNLRDEGEILSIDKTIKKDFDNINAFELFVGIQDLMNEYSNGIILKYSDDNGLALIFKIVKIYSDSKEIDENCVKNINIPKFINILIKISTIISKVFERFTCSADHQLFIKNSDIKLKKNNLYILCITILSLIKNNVSDKDIIRKTTIAVCYHAICNKIKNEEDGSEYYDKIVSLKNKDKLKYEAGGSFIDNLCRRINEEDPRFIFENITEIDIELALSIWCNQNNKPKPYKKKGKKRRQINMIEGMIFSMLYRKFVSQHDLEDKKMSVEHLVTFSSVYKGNIDIDTLGNKIPIPFKENIKRSNKHIDEYKKLCPDYYSKYINQLMSSEDYDSIVYYDEKKSPVINDNSNYETVCKRNEKYYINKVVEYLFN